MRKVDIVCVCTHGRNRSLYLKEYLQEKGYAAYAVGINNKSVSGERRIKSAKIVISVHPEIEKGLNERFDLSKKKVIKLDVDDQPSNDRRMTGEEWVQYQHEYVYPTLAKQLKKYLPISI